MSDICSAPDLSALEIPIDSWTKPFWDGAAEGKLLAPRCAACHHYRWPPGPFCPHCQSQLTEWVPSGSGRIYSFTIIRDQQGSDRPSIHVPALIEFPQSDGIRLLAAIVDTPLTAIQIGAEATVGWSRAANAMVPVFRVSH
jgi:uncharacterized OB-fold protein